MTLLTVIVPTKNRQETALYTLRNLVTLAGDGLEIIVQDCSSAASLGRMITESISDSRIRYLHDGSGSPSMTDNWNRAISRAKGKYVVIIGDDDGVSGELMRAATWADRMGLDAVSFPHSTFWWPNYPKGNRAGFLIVPHSTGQHNVRNSMDAVDEMLAKKADRVAGLPEIYHGMVSRRILERLRERTGSYCRTRIPDCYSAWAIGLLGIEFARMDYPLTICGFSYASNSGRIQRGALQEHIQEYGELPLSPGLPQSITGASFDVLLTDAISRALESVEPPRNLGIESIAGVYASFVLETLPHVRPAWAQYRDALARTGYTLRDGPALTVLLRAMMGRLQGRTRTRLAQAVPIGFLKTRHYHLDRAGDIAEAARRQNAHLKSAGVPHPFN